MFNRKKNIVEKIADKRLKRGRKKLLASQQKITPHHIVAGGILRISLRDVINKLGEKKLGRNEHINSNKTYGMKKTDLENYFSYEALREYVNQIIDPALHTEVMDSPAYRIVNQNMFDIFFNALQGQATHLDIKIEASEQGIKVTIMDNGHGFKSEGFQETLESHSEAKVLAEQMRVAFNESYANQNAAASPSPPVANSTQAILTNTKNSRLVDYAGLLKKSPTGEYDSHILSSKRKDQMKEDDYSGVANKPHPGGRGRGLAMMTLSMVKRGGSLLIGNRLDGSGAVIEVSSKMQDPRETLTVLPTPSPTTFHIQRPPSIFSVSGVSESSPHTGRVKRSSAGISDKNSNSNDSKSDNSKSDYTKSDKESALPTLSLSSSGSGGSISVKAEPEDPFAMTIEPESPIITTTLESPKTKSPK